jgi:hypothetical protein
LPEVPAGCGCGRGAGGHTNAEVGEELHAAG